MRNQKGQTVLILILVMTVALAIGISVIQRSLSDLSTSSKVEQSSRAYSAAEAGIEKAIQSNEGINTPIPLGNSSSIENVQKVDVPDRGQALEYPPLAKEELAQVWLANPETLAKYYAQGEIDIYWGDPDVADSDYPAIEVTVIYQDTSAGGAYQSKRYFYDKLATSRGNGFDSSAACPADPPIQTSLSPTAAKSFLCKKRIEIGPTVLPNLSQLILLRARLLYNNTSQSFAVAPVGNCDGADACSLPPQARLYTSTGASGETQRKVQVFRLDKVVPPYFDYAIFSAGEINKAQ